MIEKIQTSLQVDAKIVDLLSKSTYQRSFASAVRELVSNAYDADALSVMISIPEDYEEIIIHDDGNGMTLQEFKKYFTIAGTKSTTKFSRRYNRPRIGQFGIGFLSIFTYCEFLEITTTSEGSKDILTTTIPASKYWQAGKDIDVQAIPIEIKMIKNTALIKEHYTKVRLINTSYSLKSYFSEEKTNKRDSVKAMPALDRFKWELQENLPLQFTKYDEHPPEIEYKEPIKMSVFLNLQELFRNPIPRIILDSGIEVINNLTCSYAIATDFKSIRPFEARGIKIRVTNVGVGSREEFNLKRDRGFSRLHWLAGELHISSEAKEYLNISRDGFISTPSIERIRDFFSSKLREWAYYIETVAEAEKKILELFKDVKRENVEAKRKVLESNINKLVKKGFKAIEIQESNTIEKPVYIDKEAKHIYISKGLQDLDEIDKVTVLNNEFQLEYLSDFEDNSIPCRIFKNKILINSNYPLFKSRTYGAVFKKIHILLLVASRYSNDSHRVYNILIDKFLDEFNEYTK